MIRFLREWWAMRKASKWFDKNPAAQARFEDLEDWLEELEERVEKIETTPFAALKPLCLTLQLS